MDTKTVNLRDVPAELVRRAKVCATMRGLSLKDFIVEAIEQSLKNSGPMLSSASLFATSGRLGLADSDKKRKRKGAS